MKKLKTNQFRCMICDQIKKTQYWLELDKDNTIAVCKKCYHAVITFNYLKGGGR